MSCVFFSFFVGCFFWLVYNYSASVWESFFVVEGGIFHKVWRVKTPKKRKTVCTSVMKRSKSHTRTSLNTLQAPNRIPRKSLEEDPQIHREIIQLIGIHSFALLANIICFFPSTMSCPFFSPFFSHVFSSTWNQGQATVDEAWKVFVVAMVKRSMISNFQGDRGSFMFFVAVFFLVSYDFLLMDGC